MKEIFLAKKGKRMLARLIDFLLLIFSTLLVYFLAIFPFVFDSDTLVKNNEIITEMYVDSGLFIVDSEGNYTGKSAIGSYKTIDDLYSNTVKFNDIEYTISLTNSLENFYLTKFKDYGGNQNLSIETYKIDVLKVGEASSNIASYDETTHTLTLMNEENESITRQFFLETYDTACKNMISNSSIATLQSENQAIVFSSLAYIIPVLFGFALIYDLIIPLCTTYGQTIGKLIFKLALVDLNGYKLKKKYLIPRFLAYFFIEIVLGIMTFGGVFLITYTMFLFTKKRRCIHDYIAKTVVVDLNRSIIFDSAKEEEYLKKKTGIIE